MCRSVPAAVAAVAVGVSAALVLSLVARPAWGQACCASAGLVAPARLRSYEDFAVGVQAKGQAVQGDFSTGGAYRRSGRGESEWNLEQDLFGVARVFDRGQVAVVVPFIETRRAVPGTTDAGGGIGDVSVSARYDFTATGERQWVPGLSLLLGATAPTGTPPDDAGGELAAGATGQGSWEAIVGGAVEQAFQRYFATVNAALGFRTSRSIAGGRESFAPRFTGTLIVGRVLPRGFTGGMFVTAIRQGENRDDRGRIPGSNLSLVTVGGALTASLSERWRVQGTLSGNVPLDGFGRNQPAGLGGSLSVIRLWL